MKLLKQVQTWCAQPGNSKAKLAGLLGFETSSMISNWIARGEIPKRHVERIKIVIGVKGK